MNQTDADAVRARIAEVALREEAFSEAVANEVAFHMTDWLDDLAAYARLCVDPGAMSDAEVDEMLRGFLVHVPNHIAAAGKLYTGMPVTDIFDVGAISEER